ncbi:MAG: hypothetical protein PHS73_02180 [Candidatus Peribacteraceae bacterium]|nr:hypothetical protein [Candidatus Peribacteraceae bacterium]
MTHIHTFFKITAATFLAAAFGIVFSLGSGTVFAMLNACSYDDVMSIEPSFLMSMEPVFRAAAPEVGSSVPAAGISPFVAVLLFAAGFLFHSFLQRISLLGRRQHR